MKSTRTFTLVVRLAFFSLGCLAADKNDATQTLSHSGRMLELNCPIPDDDYSIMIEDLEIPDNRFERFRQLNTNSRGRALLKTIRRKPQQFYNDLVETAIMAMCDVEEEMERCVDENSSDAAKNENDECIVASGFTCGAGLCERSSNCYWKSVVEGKVRETRFPEDNYETAMDELRDYSRGSYLYGLVQWSVLGIALAIGLLVIWLLYFIARYCCCCLWTSCSVCRICSPIPRDEGYKVCLQWLIPIFLYILGFIGIVAAGCVALIGHEDINAASSASFQYVSLLIENLERFLGNTKKPLNAVKDIVQLAADDAIGVFNNTGYVATTAAAIVTSFSDFNTLHSAQLPLAASDNLDKAEELFGGKVKPIVNDIQSMLDTLEDDVYENVDTIQTSLSVAISQIESFESQASLWQADVHTFEGQELRTRTYRQLALLGIFLLGGTIALAGLVGILTSRKPGCARVHSFMNLAGILSALLGSLSLILASATLLISFVWLDICEISDIVVGDFEPLVGETIALGANAPFQDENLAEVYNVEDKIDFQKKLDDGLSSLNGVNITEQFQKVITPLEGIQSSVNDLSTMAFEQFSTNTGSSSFSDCLFNDVYSEDIALQPWLANENKTETAWFLKSTGANGDYARLNDESAEEYINRIYEVAGKCEDNSSDCCLNGECSLGVSAACNSGSKCAYDDGCFAKSQIIQQVFKSYVQQKNITADLGVVCPSSLSCPTAAFEERGYNYTVVGLVEGYGGNIKGTADKLISITTTSVGRAMVQVRKFLCEMNISFVADGYNQVRDEVCVSMLGGFAQINWSLWALGIFLEIVAILANALATRLRGLSRGEANDLLMGPTSARFVSPKIGMEDEV